MAKKPGPPLPGHRGDERGIIAVCLITSFRDDTPESVERDGKFRRNPTNQSHQRNNSDWNIKENPDDCYECGRTGHIKKYCPQLRNKTASSNSRDFKEKKFKSRKALLTWDDSDESDKEDSEDEDVAQLCFMANDNDLKAKSSNPIRETYAWYVIKNGPIIPMNDGPNRTKFPNGILEMDTQEAQLFFMDDRAKNIISCGLDINEYNRVLACEIVQEMWKLLEVTHEGTNQVKETKINMLVKQYEAFKMKENESINEMYSRFTLITNGLRLLGKVYPEKEMVKKVLRSLPKRWEAKLTAIQEAKDLNVLKLKELVGSLMTHEITMKIHDEEETTSKKKSLALKAEASHEPESHEDSDQDMAFITQKFKKFITNQRDGKIKKNQSTQS
ncbi:hypothetical protein RJ640_022572 [Escallonia rubra]|uniref:CCHC-type domain-containing protein n=1 Tax=Escallonia rubra TaxID=112253 RepID=A0AA88RS62_9ASTE|nr:hypothetical protein RJ640_022572 [Escallonia rubra]